MTTRRGLVVSPTPTHPVDQGNRNRVRQMTEFLAAEGFAVDFVLYPIDEDWQDRIPDGLAEMLAAWQGIVAVVPPSRPMHQPPLAQDHQIDEWYDPAVDAQLAFLCARRRYDVMWVHYAFMSRAFAHAPPGCVKVLDAHDVLAGRRELFERHGATPEFFHTTAREEAKALARADVVVAIKPSDARHFAALGARTTVTVPLLVGGGPPPCSTGPDRGETLQVGFIGADNVVNRHNLLKFIERLSAFRAVFLPDLKLIVAGSVCRHLPAGSDHPAADWLDIRGRVDRIEDFYRDVDLVIAPLAFSTGLKVKIAEALAWSISVMALADAFDGFSQHDAFHSLPSHDAMCAALMTLAADRPRLRALAAASRRSGESLRKATDEGLARLRSLLSARARRLVVVTDVLAGEDGQAAGCLTAARAIQLIAYFAHLVPVTAINVGPALVIPMPANAEFVAVPTREAAGHAIDEVDARAGILALFVSLAEPAGGELAGWARYGRRQVIDHWPGIASGRMAMPKSGRVLVTDDGLAVAATPLRHLPPSLNWRHAPDIAVTALVIAANPIDPCLTAALWERSGARVIAVRTRGLAGDAEIMQRFATMGRPSVIVTVDSDMLTRELAAALAAWCGAAHFDISADSHPRLMEGKMIGNADQHIAAVSAWLRSPSALPGSECAPDAGWSVVWRWIESLRHETTDAGRDANARISSPQRR